MDDSERHSTQNDLSHDQRGYIRVPITSHWGHQCPLEPAVCQREVAKPGLHAAV
jgi:hypothetical protein